MTFREFAGYISVNLRELQILKKNGKIAFELVATDGVYVTEFSVVVTITNEFEELVSFGSIDNPITTNADGTFIAGDDLSIGRGVFYMLFPGETSWDGWYARDYGGDTSIAASSTGTEFVTGEKNGSCTTSTGGQGSMSIYMYSSYRSYPDEQCFSDGLITGNAVDISYDGRRIATHVYSNNDHGVAIYDYSESGNKFF